MTEQIFHDPTTDPTTVAPISGEHEQVVRDRAAPLGQLAVEARTEPTYVAIEASIGVMEQEVTAAKETMGTTYEASTDEVKQRIDQLEESYVATVQAAEEQDQECPSLTDFLSTAENIPEEFKLGMVAYAASTAKIEAAEKELEEHAPEKAADVQQKAAELVASLDYDKVVARAYANDDDTRPFGGRKVASIQVLYDVSKVIGVQKLLESGTPVTYRRLVSVERSLEMSAAKYQEKGLIREPGEAMPETAVPLTDAQIADIEAHIKDVSNLHKKYKKVDRITRRKTQAILGLARQTQERDDEVPTDLDELYEEDKIIYNDALRAAINRRLAQKLTELPTDEFETDIHSEVYARLVEQARSVIIGEALEMLEVGGSFEDLPFKFSKVELEVFLLTSIPAAALESVKRIQFRPLTQEEDTEDNTLGLHKWSEELGGSEIIISDAKVSEHYQETLKLLADYPDAEQFALRSSKNKMLQTITHEFGHELLEILPVAALKRWEDQRATDPTNITAYVKSYHDSNHTHRYEEDFADTMGLFINLPEVLTVISPTRFDAMQQIFEEFMPLYPSITKKSQEHRIGRDRTTRLSRGISDEDVKSTHLYHETA